jgi:hypothetical protein
MPQKIRANNASVMIDMRHKLLQPRKNDYDLFAMTQQMKPLTVFVLSFAVFCGSCGRQQSVPKQPSQSVTTEDPEDTPNVKAARQVEMSHAIDALDELEKQRGNYEETRTKIKKFNHALDAAGENKYPRIDPNFSARTTEQVGLVYGLIPKLHRESGLSDVLIQAYESKGQKPSSSSPEAVELCQQFFAVAKDAEELNKYTTMTAVSKTYSDAIEQLHPVLMEADSKVKQVFGLGLLCRLGTSRRQEIVSQAR